MSALLIWALVATGLVAGLGYALFRVLRGAATEREEHAAERAVLAREKAAAEGLAKAAHAEVRALAERAELQRIKLDAYERELNEQAAVLAAQGKSNAELAAGIAAGAAAERLRREQGGQPAAVAGGSGGVRVAGGPVGARGADVRVALTRSLAERVGPGRRDERPVVGGTGGARGSGTHGGDPG